MMNRLEKFNRILKVKKLERQLKADTDRFMKTIDKVSEAEEPREKDVKLIGELFGRMLDAYATLAEMGERSEEDIEKVSAKVIDLQNYLAGCNS